MAAAADTKFKKGQKRGPGRPKGATAGGVEYLERKANDPRTAAAFLGLVGKVLPMQVTGGDGGPLVVEIVRYGEGK
jgi:hypothetical protein